MPSRGGRNPALRGTAFEREVVRDLTRRGYLCIRSAGSKGPVDVVALERPGIDQPGCGCPALVQAKKDGRITALERGKLFALAQHNEVHAIIASRRDLRREPGADPIRYRAVTGRDGEMEDWEP